MHFHKFLLQAALFCCLFAPCLASNQHSISNKMLEIEKPLQSKPLNQYITWKKEQPEHKLLPAINNARSLYYQDSKKNLCPHQVKKNAKHASKELDPEDIFAPGNEKKRMLSHLRLGNCYETIQIPQYNAKKTTNP